MIEIIIPIYDSISSQIVDRTFYRIDSVQPMEEGSEISSAGERWGSPLSISELKMVIDTARNLRTTTNHVVATVLQRDTISNHTGL